MASRSIATALLAIAVVGLVAVLVLFARDYGRMPEIVPTHFGADGAPDGWGPKRTLLIFPVMATAFFGVYLLAASGVLTAFGASPPAFPLLVRALAAESIWLFYSIESAAMSGALGSTSGLGAGFFATFGLVMATAIGAAVYGIVWGFRSRR